MKLLKVCWMREKLENYNNIDVLWFNFIESSKRYITPEKASEIDTPFSCLRVWVFWIQNKDKSWKELNKTNLVDIIMTAREAKMNAIQIHWNCDFSYLKLYNYLVFSSVNIEDLIIHHPSGASFNTKGSNVENIDFYIIDWIEPWSWKWYDFSKINELNLENNFLVAGGISEKNVWEVFEIFKNNEYFSWVDIASWVDNWENICLEKVGKIVKKMK